MFYLIYNNYGECPHFIDDIDNFYIDDVMLRLHSVSSGDISICLTAWNNIHLTYYSYDDYMLNQEVKNGKNQIH